MQKDKAIVFDNIKQTISVNVSLRCLVRLLIGKRKEARIFSLGPSWTFNYGLLSYPTFISSN